MSVEFNELMAADATEHFLADFGELIDYFAAGEPAAILILAIVERRPLHEAGRGLAAPIQIDVAVQDVPVVNLTGETGIAGGGDRVKIKRDLDDAEAVWMPVTAIIQQDAGMWRLAVGR